MTQDSNFNPTAFMNETFDAPELDTKLIPVPEGEHVGQIGTDDKDVNPVTGVGKNGKLWLRLDLMVELTDPNLKQELQREKVIIRYGMMLDLNEQGRLDLRPQRNIGLGKLRDAVNQNKPGQWSFSQLKGQPIKVRVKRKTIEGYDEPISEVVGVTRP